MAASILLSSITQIFNKSLFKGITQMIGKWRRFYPFLKMAKNLILVITALSQLFRQLPRYLEDLFITNFILI